MRQMTIPRKNRVETMVHSNRTFRISRQNFLDKFFTSIGYSKKIKISNEQFDNQFYIESDDEDFITLLRNNIELQELITELMLFNVKSIEQSQHSLSAICKKEVYLVNNKKILELLEKIKEVLKELPNVRVKKFWAIWKLILALMFIFFCFGLIFTYRDIDRIAVSGLFQEAVKYSIPLYIILLVPALIKSFRKSYAHIVLFINCGALLLIPCAVYIALVYINIHYDNDPIGKPYCTYVDQKRETRAMDSFGFNHSLVLKSCDQNNFSFEFYTNQGLWSSLHYGDKVKVMLHKGRLGYPWGSNMTIVSNNN